jgi:glycosyltransferase involved in cell wall biosynthesis
MISSENTKKPIISIVLPCRNEEEALPYCLEKIIETIKKNNYNAEIIVSDSSIDNSPKIAEKYGVIVAKHNKDGYGNAYLEGIKVSKGDILILGDADDTYDFREIPNLLKYINNYDLVLGQRKFLHEGSMPFVNRYIGNPILSWILRFLFKASIKDCHTGFRIIKKSALDRLNLKTTGMEFASEMIIKAVKNNLKIKEVPINYYARKGETKLQRIPDGWRHIRFMLLYSPLYLFFIPGVILFLLGIFSMLIFYLDLSYILGIKLYYHPMFLSSMLIISGYQLIFFSIFAKTYAITHLEEKSPIMNKLYKIITIEKASILGFIILFMGCFIYINIFVGWIYSGFGELQEVKNSIVALTLILLSLQTISSSFMLSILGIKEK